MAGFKESSGPTATSYAWKDSAWRVFLERNETTRGARRYLTLKLLGMDDYARVFDQLVLLMDIPAAEQLLARRFIGIYEGFAPEVVFSLTVRVSELPWRFVVCPYGGGSDVAGSWQWVGTADDGCAFLIEEFDGVCAAGNVGDVAGEWQAESEFDFPYSHGGVDGS
ncbi:hypothetical protein [Bifidobacterium sp.]|uniref:hypothetical protein n=1 Tax=Bifidobacterium sp. TaxID=41200 RepID=UPI0025B8096D|nr:hypothetical protein [Bifidobacterium sp.]MCH4209557.1 hypothetical protein [Bifidobacterium sp.]